MDSKKFGSMSEIMAKEYLENQGYKVLNMNYYTRFGEIDIIAREDSYLVFIEVKSRKTLGSGHPLEAITALKMKKIISSANYYIYSNKISTSEKIRFDVVSIVGKEINILKNAFGGMA
jgi:putative endonuclease